jgi:hypothetical protein
VLSWQKALMIEWLECPRCRQRLIQIWEKADCVEG